MPAPAVPFLLAAGIWSQGNGNILDHVSRAGPVVKAVLVLLVGLSVISWGIIFFKSRVLKSAVRENRLFLDVTRQERSLERVYEHAKHLTNSPISNIFRQAYIESVKIRYRGPARPGSGRITATLPSLSSLERTIKWITTAEVEQLERSVGFLATVGSTAPFIGLFGTVWGIMNSFQEIGAQGAASFAVVAPGISEALVATAVGLFAAIPAVIAYNRFANKIRIIIREIENYNEDLLDEFRRQFGRMTETIQRSGT